MQEYEITNKLWPLKITLNYEISNHSVTFLKGDII